MGIPTIVGLCVAGVCLVLLIIALVQLSGLRSALSETDKRVRQLPRPAEDAGRIDRTASMLQVLLDQMRRLDEAVATLRPSFSSPTPASAAPPPPPPPSPPQPSASAERAVAAPKLIVDIGSDGQGLKGRAFEPFPEERASADRTAPAPAAEQVAKPWVAPASEPPPSQAATSEREVEVLDEYRKLIAQPRKAEINRWTDDHDGESCEATDDGTFRPLDREAGGLLVLLPLGRDRAMVLPAGRMVVDFATNFANALSLRSVTRQTFELVEDGSGVLRLVEPAYAERLEGVWRLSSPGRLSGLNPG
ncbi:hypothetical protein E5673_10330 [Sphingomonas sp. PAMC26645]|uniref:hypothetical protein n=1 Tax=Sphingomonas sp. PAMC26645 TaxID=2565555 RepID=UPI00109E1148|nr:hypothetical protein [Sphingomonas sp. PAMC26645]QCB42576.1 hypothetical protein E5673_10330 [Sphingomonas sp. PAMC26645]